MNKLIVVRADEWEGLFVNGHLKEEGHSLNEGEHYLKYSQRTLEKYSPCSIEVKYVTDRYYENYLSVYGRLPEYLDDVELYD